MIGQEPTTEAGWREHYKRVNARVNAPALVTREVQRYREAAAAELERARAAEAKIAELEKQLAAARETEATLRVELHQGATCRDMIRLVSGVSGYSPQEVIADRKQGHLVKARQIAMWLTRGGTTASLPMIGRHFGGRDHTTVLHAVRRVDAVIAYLGLRLDDKPNEERARILWSVKWPRTLA